MNTGNSQKGRQGTVPYPNFHDYDSILNIGPNGTQSQGKKLPMQSLGVYPSMANVYPSKNHTAGFEPLQGPPMPNNPSNSNPFPG
jgi:hypothetical protein